MTLPIVVDVVAGCISKNTFHLIKGSIWLTLKNVTSLPKTQSKDIYLPNDCSVWPFPLAPSLQFQFQFLLQKSHLKKVPHLVKGIAQAPNH